MSRYRENTLQKVRGTLLFQDKVRFAEYSTTTLTQENAGRQYAMGLQLLHFYPEAGVLEKLIDCARMLDKKWEAREYHTPEAAANPSGGSSSP